VQDRHLQRAKQAPLSWQPGQPAGSAWPTWQDEKVVDLGPDPDGTAFETIAEAMLSGNYYPPSAVRFFGDFRAENRHLKRGDRILQYAPLFGPFGLWSAAEITIAELDPGKRCEIGYVTTQFHHGRGEWRALLTRNAEENQSSELIIRGLVRPRSWLFWTFLPVARHMQKRARRLGIELQRARAKKAA
jgi:hypothetical protein